MGVGRPVAVEQPRMPIDRALVSGSGNCWDTLSTLVAADGSKGHSLFARLGSGMPGMRDLADAVHHIAILHGRHPGVVDLAVSHAPETVSGWMASVNEQFATERAYLVRLVAAVGPLPSTPGQAESEAAVAAQQHALEMLGQSDRRGCALGASVALILDWPSVRQMLDVAANRVGIDPPALNLPELSETAAVVLAASEGLAIERAMAFGAQQLLAQHRGLWDLLEARASARDAH